MMDHGVSGRRAMVMFSWVEKEILAYCVHKEAQDMQVRANCETVLVWSNAGANGAEGGRYHRLHCMQVFHSFVWGI